MARQAYRHWPGVDRRDAVCTEDRRPRRVNSHYPLGRRRTFIRERRTRKSSAQKTARASEHRSVERSRVLKSAAPERRLKALLLTKEEYRFSGEVVLCFRGRVQRTTPSSEADATPPS